MQLPLKTRVPNNKMGELQSSGYLFPAPPHSSPPLQELLPLPGLTQLVLTFLDNVLSTSLLPTTSYFI